MHEIKNEKQLELLGYHQNQYLKSSQDYLYGHGIVEIDLLKEFIKKGVKGELDKYYKTEEPHPLAPIRALVGSQFEDSVVKDQGDHVVYQYSGFCPTCKKVSPIIGAFAKVVQEKGRFWVIKVWA